MFVHRLSTCFLIAICLGYSGCTPHSDPMASWKGLCTFSNAANPPTITIPKEIEQDARAFYQTLSEEDKARAKGDDSAFSYLEDGTGQHAVVINASTSHEFWHYALIYDRNINEVGVGLATKPAGVGDGKFPLVETEDYGFPGVAVVNGKGTIADAPAYVLGVVYTDANANGLYNVGEGVAGVTVTMDDGAYYTVTGASGG